jgi:hypothetical protein
LHGYPLDAVADVASGAAVTEPTLRSYPRDAVADVASGATVTDPTLHGYPQDTVADAANSATVTEPTLHGYPQDTAADVANSSATVTEPTLHGYPQDTVADAANSGAAATDPSLRGYPQDHVEETPAAKVTPAESPPPADHVPAPLDQLDPAVIATSIAGAFFDDTPKDTPKPKSTSFPTSSHAKNLTFPPFDSPPLLLRDVQSDADLSYLRTKYRARYVELEEMLEYAAATGKLDPVSLGLEVKKLKKIFFYESPDYLTVQSLCEAEADMEELYSTLSQVIYPASIQTLRATSELYPVKHSWWSSWLLGSNSEGLNFFRQIFWVAIALIAMLFFKEYIGFYVGGIPHEDPPGSISSIVQRTPLELFNRMLQVITPFVYGAIGSLVYVYKTLSDLYVCRTLDPNKLANNWMRLFMGGLMGGLTVALFYQQYFQGGLDNEKISAVAVAFLTGYSVEFFYRILDRIINTVIPKSEEDNAVQSSIVLPKQQQMDSLFKRLKESKSEEDKAIIRSMLEKL